MDMARLAGGARGVETRGPADESVPTGVPPRSPPARAGNRVDVARLAGDTGVGQTLGVVLAGGLSRRMGALGPKAALPIGGESLLARVVRRLRAAGLSSVLVVGPPELAALAPDATLAADQRPGAHGPLAGLEAALLWASDTAATRADLAPGGRTPYAPATRHSLSSRERGTGGEVGPDAPYRRAFVVACDMPFVCLALVRAMVERATQQPDADALVLRSASGTEQLHAVYALACLPTASALLDSGARSLRELLAHVRSVEFPPEEAARYDPAGLSAFNANTLDDWRRALAIAASEG